MSSQLPFSPSFMAYLAQVCLPCGITSLYNKNILCVPTPYSLLSFYDVFKGKEVTSALIHVKYVIISMFAKTRKIGSIFWQKKLMALILNIKTVLWATPSWSRCTKINFTAFNHMFECFAEIWGFNYAIKCLFGGKVASF